jgi:hypothetical protein
MLRRLQDSRDPDYAEIVKIYVASVGPDIRTNSNQITYWLDRSYREFGDEFIICGFYEGRRIIGFAQMAFLRQHRILFFDYVVLQKGHRSHGEYFQFARMLEEWIVSESLEFDYAVAEVSYESSGQQPSEHSISLVQLFKLIGFGVAQCEYYQPSLGPDNPQSDVRAHLLVASHERLSMLKRETVVHIVRAVYFQHYERWFAPFLADRNSYRAFLEQRLSDLENRLSNRKEVVVNGIRLLHSPNLSPPAPISKRSIPLWRPLFVTLVTGILCIGLFFVQSRAQLPWQAIALLFAGTLLIVSTAFALFDRRTQNVLRSLLNAVTKFSDRNK